MYVVTFKNKAETELLDMFVPSAAGIVFKIASGSGLDGMLRKWFSNVSFTYLGQLSVGVWWEPYLFVWTNPKLGVRKLLRHACQGTGRSDRHQDSKISQPPATLGMFSSLITTNKEKQPNITWRLPLAMCHVPWNPWLETRWKTTAANQGRSVTPKLGVNLPRVLLLAGQTMCLVSSVTWCSSLSMWCVCESLRVYGFNRSQLTKNDAPFETNTLSQLNCTMHLSSHSIFGMKDFLSKIRT